MGILRFFCLFVWLVVFYLSENVSRYFLCYASTQPLDGSVGKAFGSLLPLTGYCVLIFSNLKLNKHVMMCAQFTCRLCLYFFFDLTKSVSTYINIDTAHEIQ